MENYVGKVCPYCKTEIKEDESVKVCDACGIAHHEACWEENKGCTTFGCSEQHYEEQGTNPTDVCKNCGAPLGDGQAFCAQCGTAKVEEKKNVCGKCGAILQEGQGFCPQCGQKADLAVDANVNSAISMFNATVEKKKKNTALMPVIIAIVVAIVGFIGFFVYSTVQENKKQEAIEQYREDAAAFHSTTLSSGSDMEDIGNAIQTAWGKYVNNSRYGAYYNGTYLYSVDDAVEAAQKEQAEKISDVISGDSNIQSLYKALLVIPDPEDQELQEIKEAVKEVYDAYEDMYGVVINVSGNYNSFKSDFGDTDSELADALGKLRNLLN